VVLVLAQVAVLVPVVLLAAALVAQPVAAQLLAVVQRQVVQQPVAQQQLVQVPQQQPVRRQPLEPQQRSVWWQLVWRLQLSWLLQRLKRMIPFTKTPPPLPHLELVPHWWSQAVRVLPTAEIYFLS
jgi:hypothetical protein